MRCQRVVFCRGRLVEEVCVVSGGRFGDELEKLLIERNVSKERLEKVIITRKRNNTVLLQR
jgi:hypothetical protein